MVLLHPIWRCSVVHTPRVAGWVYSDRGVDFQISPMLHVVQNHPFQSLAGRRQTERNLYAPDEVPTQCSSDAKILDTRAPSAVELRHLLRFLRVPEVHGLHKFGDIFQEDRPRQLSCGCFHLQRPRSACVFCHACCLTHEERQHVVVETHGWAVDLLAPEPRSAHLRVDIVIYATSNGAGALWCVAGPACETGGLAGNRQRVQTMAHHRKDCSDLHGQVFHLRESSCTTRTNLPRRPQGPCGHHPRSCLGRSRRTKT